MSEERAIFTNGKIVGERVSLETYLAQPEGVKRGDPRFVMRNGELQEFRKNPMKWMLAGADKAEAQAEAEEEGESVVTEQKGFQLWGTLVDCLLTMPQDIETRFVTTPATYTNAKGVVGDWTNKSPVCRDWTAGKRAQGLEVVTPDMLAEGRIAAARMRADPEIAALLAGAAHQVMVRADYTDEMTGIVVPFKVLIDAVPLVTGAYGRSVANLKTCRDGSYQKWVKGITEHGYDIQGCLELDVYNAAMPDEKRVEYYHPIQESKPPYVPGRRDLGQDGFLYIGRVKVARALKLYCACLKANYWPGYDDPLPGQTVLNRGWTRAEPLPWQMSEVM